MKIVNSHYIPLPAPHWLIVDPMGYISKQIGTLTIIEDLTEQKGECNFRTHSYPVVTNASVDNLEKVEDEYLFSGSIGHADGKVLNELELDDCFQLCLNQHRTLNYMRFNALVFVLLTRKSRDSFFLDEFISELKNHAIEFIFPKEELQEITITTYNGQQYGNDSLLLVSDMDGIMFLVPYYAYDDEEGTHLDWDKIFMEFVNQARAYLTIDPKYRFHFKTSVESLNPLIERLNNELNDYLERKEK